MTRVTFLHVTITGTLLGVVTYLFVQSTSVDPADHVRSLQVINALTQTNTELRRNLLLARSGLLLHYDTVNQTVVNLHRQLEALRFIKAANPNPSSEELTARIESVAANLAEEEELVERFKSGNALLRNSWAYFAQRSHTVSELSSFTPSSDEFNTTISQLLPAMLRVLRRPHREATELATAQLNRLNGMTVPRPLKSQLASMVMHGHVLLKLSPDLDATLNSLLTSETAARLDALRTAYLDYHRRIEDRAERHRVLLYAASLLLFIYLGYLFFRLRAGARALEQLNEGLLEEISERKQAEERSRDLQAELAHAHRLSLMGEMASGLAHELNQPLTAIRLYAKGCVRRLRSGEGTRDEILAAMDHLSAQVLRAGEIVGWIRSFVRKKQPRTSSVNVNAMVREAIDLLSNEGRNQHIAVKLDLSHGLPRVEADKIEIQQIILNLTRNSMEAINEDGCRPANITIHTSKSDNDAVEVTVQDTGPGMAPEVIERAFDSFFTTKPHGMGLGLSICRSMVEAHGGQLWASSKEGVGTTFHFTLPTAKEERHDGVRDDGLCYR